MDRTVPPGIPEGEDAVAAVDVADLIPTAPSNIQVKDIPGSPDFPPGHIVLRGKAPSRREAQTAVSGALGNSEDLGLAPG